MDPLEKIPPQNIEAEKSLLGSLLIDKEAIYKIADMIVPEDFYKQSHQMIFEAILELFLKHEPIDLLTVTNRLTEKNQLEIIGGRGYLASLGNAVPTSSHVATYADIVQKKATFRRLITASTDINKLGYQEDENLDDVLDKAERYLFSVAKKYLKQAFTPIKNLLTSAFERIDELHKESGKLRGIPTYFTDLDNILAGLQESNLIIIAARPSIGKTSFALDIARNIAVKAKLPVGIFSLEMSQEELVDRMLCAEAGVSLWKMRTGRLSDKGINDDFTKIGRAISVLSEASIYIDDSSTSNVIEIRTKARRLQAEKGLGVLIIDYLQLIESRTSIENRVQEISEITRAFKSIARELKIPIIALSQLSRAVEARRPAIPKLADLRESGSIEQDADIVMFIYRKSMDRSVELQPGEKNIAEIHIQKHRNGPTGMVKLYFNEEHVSFNNLLRQ